MGASKDQGFFYRYKVIIVCWQNKLLQGYLLWVRGHFTRFRQAKKLQQAVTTASTICIHMGLTSPLLPTQSRNQGKQNPGHSRLGKAPADSRGTRAQPAIPLELIRATQTFSKWWWAASRNQLTKPRRSSQNWAGHLSWVQCGIRSSWTVVKADKTR